MTIFSTTKSVYLHVCRLSYSIKQHLCINMCNANHSLRKIHWLNYNLHSGVLFVYMHLLVYKQGYLLCWKKDPVSTSSLYQVLWGHWTSRHISVTSSVANRYHKCHSSNPDRNGNLLQLVQISLLIPTMRDDIAAKFFCLVQHICS